MYPQHSSSQVAQRPLYAEIGEIASELTRAIDLTEKEAQLVQDIRKGRNRFVMLELLLDIASRHPGGCGIAHWSIRTAAAAEGRWIAVRGQCVQR